MGPPGIRIGAQSPRSHTLDCLGASRFLRVLTAVDSAELKVVLGQLNCRIFFSRGSAELGVSPHGEQKVGAFKGGIPPSWGAFRLAGAIGFVDRVPELLGVGQRFFKKSPRANEKAPSPAPGSSRKGKGGAFIRGKARFHEKFPEVSGNFPSDRGEMVERWQTASFQIFFTKSLKLPQLSV